MILQELGLPFLFVSIIAGLLAGGALLLMRKKGLFLNKRQEALPGDLADWLRYAPDQLPEKIFIQMKEEGVNLVSEIVKNWSELSPEKRDQLSSFWESQGYIDLFIKGLGAKVEEKRVEAAQVLMVMKNKKLILPLMDALESPNQYVPARVAEVLLSYGPDAVELMICRLPDLSDQAKCLVISILEEFGDRQAVPPLLQELSHPSSQVRMKTLDALGEIGDGEAVDSIIRMMDDADWGVRSRAAKALGKIPSPKGVSALEKALQDDAWWVRANAKEALRRISPMREGKTGELS